MKAFLLAAALASSSAAATTDQFDLICTGTSQGYPTDRPENTRYRVDLAAKQWCSLSCSDIRPIAEIEPSTIWFKNKQKQFASDTEWIEYVSRTSGKWVRVMGPWVTDGTCEPAPFSGFPTLNTKF